MLWELYAHVQGGGAAHYSIHLYKGVGCTLPIHMYKGVGLHITLYTCTRGCVCTLSIHMYKGVCLHITLYTCTRGWGSIVYVCTSASLRSEVVEEGAEVALLPSDVDKGIGSCHAGTLPAITFTHGAIGAVTG